MKKKVFFIVSSLGVGGSERVFWLLSQNFNKELYDISIIEFDSRNDRLSKDLDDVTVIDLKTIRASKSFYKLLSLIKKEKPYAVFSTAAHLNLLLAFVSIFIKIPSLVGREANIYREMAEFGGARTKFWGLFINFFYRRFNKIVCQSDEMKESFVNQFSIAEKKLIIIPNPVVIPERFDGLPKPNIKRKILIVARLASEKGHIRLLKILANLPRNYFLTIAGDGPLKEEILEEIKLLKLEKQVNMLGHVSDINELITRHNVFALTSYTEGFPNAVLEALAMGMPVVAFKVGGITQLIKPDFNGYIIKQDDNQNFTDMLVKACDKNWDKNAIIDDITERFSIQKIARQYEALIQ